MEPESFEGQCQCGSVKYKVTGTPITLFACHCSQCQRQSSSAFGMALWIKDTTVVLASGQLAKWNRQLPAGGEMECSFCSVCGTRVFHRVIGSDVISVKPGTLHDRKWMTPAGHIWTAEKQKWVTLNENSTEYSEEPETFSELISKWSEFSSHVEAGVSNDSS